MKLKTIATTTTALLVFAGAQAATITGVTIEDFSSERGGFGRNAVNVLDGDLGTDWQTNNDAAKTITFDLGQVYQVDSFTLWNYMGQDASDVEDVLISYGETAALGSSLGTLTFATSSGTAGQEKTFSTISARYLEFDIQTMHVGDASLSSTRAGFTDIAFNAIPEPGSFALLAGMFGLTWVMLRRRA